MEDLNSAASFKPDDISDWCWNIIAIARRDRNQLNQLLAQASRRDLIRFCHEFHEAAVQLTDAPYTNYMAAASEDDIQDTAEWVVSQGKEFFSSIWDHPEELLKYQDVDPQSNFTSVAENVFWQKFNEPMPPFNGLP